MLAPILDVVGSLWSRDNAREVPLWVWLVALTPWIWMVPAGQYFWDDWVISANRGLDAQQSYWALGAKHPMNPYIFSILLPLGPWVFHALTILATLAMARSLSSILSASKFLDARIAAWAGPIAVAAPVFHARVSVATLEYSICLAAVFAGWRIILSRKGPFYELLAISLLIFSIGVPSLAIVFPVIWLTLVLANRKPHQPRHFLKSSFRYSYVLAIPLAYSLYFQFFLNTRSKFKVSRDGLIDFNNDLVRLIIFSVVTLLMIRRFRRDWFSFSWRVLVAMLAAYLALFPYFAVGYKPLFDFMPWKMREDVKAVAIPRLALVGSVLLIVALLVYVMAARRVQHRWSGLVPLVIVAVVVFGSATAVLGPMDWESRHWLIAWPALATLAVAAVSGVTSDLRRAVALTTFMVFVSSAVFISSEYVVDSLKQRAIVQAVRKQSEAIRHEGATEDFKHVFVNLTQASSTLNARYRNLRQYEWWGLVAKGLEVPPSKLKLLDLQDVDLVRGESCDEPVSVLAIAPVVESSRVRALTRFLVDVEMNASTIELCNIRIVNGWPRDPKTQSP